MTARGSVIRRGKSYSVVLDLGRSADGKRIRRWHSGYPDVDTAEKARTELLGRLDNTTYTPPTKTTVRDFVEKRWLPHIDSLVAPGRLRLNTRTPLPTSVRAVHPSSDRTCRTCKAVAGPSECSLRGAIHFRTPQDQGTTSLKAWHRPPFATATSPFTAC